VRNWGYDTLEREVRANLVYRAFTRIGDGKVPDAKTLARIGQVIGPKVIRDLHERLVAIAREHGVVKGRKLRVDTTVVETNIHYPTDSSLLGNGARVLTRTRKIDKKAGGLKQKIRDRMRASLLLGANYMNAWARWLCFNLKHTHHSVNFGRRRNNRGSDPVTLASI
jgi:IS5 family transposase